MPRPTSGCETLTEYMYIATVGKTPEKILIGLRSRLNIKRVCLIGDDEVITCMEHIKDFSEKLGYTVELAKANAYDVLDIASKIDEIIHRNKNYAFVINISSGTRVMTIGALLAAHINQAEVIYVPQQISEKTPLYLDIPSLRHLMEKISSSTEVLVHKEDVMPELTKRMKEDYPMIHAEALTHLIEKMMENKFEFSAWDTRFERYPTLTHLHEKTKTKMIREDAGPNQLVTHFDARCTRCETWFGFPLEMGLGYIPTASILSQGENPPKAQPAPSPLNSEEYVNLLLKSKQEFYCPRCTLLLGLNNIIERLKKTKIVV